MPSKKYITTKNKELTDIVSTLCKLDPETKEMNDNLDSEERNALNELRKLTTTSIEIKKADKSNTFVLMDKKDYKEKLVLKGHLETPTYEKAEQSANKKVYKNLVNLCNKYQECITKNERKVILNDEWTESKFYILPKTHKCAEILNKIKEESADYIQMPMPDDLKGRPINGGVKSVTQGISKLMEKILKPLVMHLKTFIKDEFDFIRKIPGTVPSNIYAVSCDVTSLYTSIPSDLGLKAIDFWIDRLSHLVQRRFTKPFILESILFILENNYFMFDECMWHQLTGTAMGKAFAPPYACLTMGFLEETELFPKLIPSRFDAHTSEMIMAFFYRYIDDNFNFLPETVSLNAFLGVLNSMHESIKFTGVLPTPCENMEAVSTNFLAIKVIVTSTGAIKTDVFYKETNAHDYLAFDSHHPRHTKENVPYTLAKRIIFITSEDEWIQKNLNDLRVYLSDRKYPNDVIEKGIHNASLQGPAPLPKNEKVIPLITPYLSNYDSRNIKNVANGLISNSMNPRIKKAFNDTKIIQCYSQPRNLSGLLTNSAFITESITNRPRHDAGIFHCSHGGCKICKMYLQKCSSFVTSNNSVWKVKCYASCNSKNVLYLLVCNFCNTTSKTGKTDVFRARTNNHISGCKGGAASDEFDTHVYNCSRNRNVPHNEPYFKAYIYMVASDYNKLLNLERKLHLAGHDTLNNPHS